MKFFSLCVSKTFLIRAFEITLEVKNLLFKSALSYLRISSFSLVLSKHLTFWKDHNGHSSFILIVNT